MSDEYSIYWDGVKSELESQLSPNDMFMWINNITYVSFNMETKSLILAVPSNFVKINVTERFKTTIIETLANISGYNCTVELIVKNDNTQPKEKLVEKKEIKSSLNEVNKKDPEIKPQPIVEKKPQQKYSPNKSFSMEENYYFESFIIGSSNEFAAHAAKAVAENPGRTYNPYFIWGESGLGKTHLLKSIYNHVKETFPSKSVKYVTSEDFINDFISHLQSKTPEKFRTKYRLVDLLIIDDVQFFANKEALQGEFFNTFNALYDDNKQMVFSCDQPIHKVKNLSNRLKGRFSMGLTVDLIPPDYELKMAILKSMSEKYNINFDSDAMEYIAVNVAGNIRELKGAFKDVLAYSSIMKISTITLDIVRNRLKDKVTDVMYNSPITADKIIQVVAEYYSITTSELIGSKRTKSLALARQVAMYITRKETKLSTTQIGKHFGDREHGTVMHATKKIDDLINDDTKIKGDIEHIKEQLKNS